jgi:hypothetical protein
MSRKVRRLSKIWVFRLTNFILESLQYSSSIEFYVLLRDWDLEFLLILLAAD